MLARDLLLIEIAPTTEPPDPYHILPPPMPPIPVSGAPLPFGVTSAIPKGTAFTLQMAVANALGTPTWSASGLPAGTSIDPVTGLISGAGTAQGDSYATITADDTASGGTVTTTLIRLSIGAAFSLVGSLKQATRGQAYQGNVIAIGATGTLTWTMSGNPVGMTINGSTGLITGSTVTPGTYNVTISAHDAGTNTDASITVPLIVNRVINAIALDGSLSVVPKILAGSAFATIATACNTSATTPAGTQPIIWTASNLPVGVDIDEQSGIVSGQTIASAVGSYIVPITATDVWGNTFTRNVTFVVISGIKAIAPGQFAAGDAVDGVSGVDFIAAFFGDGSDGDLVSNGSNTAPGCTLAGGVLFATRDLYFNNLTPVAGGSLVMGQHKLYVAGNWDISNAPSGAVTASATPNSIAAGALGGTGAVGPAGLAGNGTAGIATSTQNYGAGGGGNASTLSGKGGNGTGGTGGATAQTGGLPREYQRTILATFLAFSPNDPFPLLPIIGGMGGASGGSGAGNGTLAGGNAGFGGGGGGRLIVYARRIVRGASTAAGVLAAIGSDGGNGVAGAATGRGGGGGGCGGCGGAIWLAYQELDGTLPAALWIDASSGKGGNGGASGGGTATAGNGGASGEAGSITLVDIGTPQSSVTAPTGTNANSGVTGGAAKLNRISI